MAVSKAQRDSLREQKKNAFASMMQAEPTEENNAVDKNLAAYAETVGQQQITEEPLAEDIISVEEGAYKSSDKSDEDFKEQNAMITEEETNFKEREELEDTIPDIQVHAAPAEAQNKNESVTQTVKAKKEKLPKKEKSHPISLADRYTGPIKTTTLLLPESVNEYMYFRCIEESKSFKLLFKELLVNEIDNGVVVEDELLRSYRKTQKETVKKCVQLEEDFQAEIKKTAIKYHLKYTNFIAYVLDKARLADNK